MHSVSFSQSFFSFKSLIGRRLENLYDKFFYPDFAAMLNDGRILVVEYKGEIYVDVAQEKKNIGERWEEESAGKVLFLMAVKRDEGKKYLQAN